jgi:hypothetical protein
VQNEKSNTQRELAIVRGQLQKGCDKLIEVTGVGGQRNLKL